MVTRSTCVDPRHCSLPTPEKKGLKDSPEPTNVGYGWVKRMEALLTQSKAKEFGLEVLIALPDNSYAPRNDFNPERSQLIPTLIHRGGPGTEPFARLGRTTAIPACSRSWRTMP